MSFSTSLALAVLVVAAITRMPAVSQLIRYFSALISLIYHSLHQRNHLGGSDPTHLRTFPSLMPGGILMRSTPSCSAGRDRGSEASALRSCTVGYRSDLDQRSILLASSDINQLVETYGHRLESDTMVEASAGSLDRTASALSGQVNWSGGLSSIDTVAARQESRPQCLMAH